LISPLAQEYRKNWRYTVKPITAFNSSIIITVSKTFFDEKLALSIQKAPLAPRTMMGQKGPLEPEIENYLSNILWVSL